MTNTVPSRRQSSSSCLHGASAASRHEDETWGHVPWRRSHEYMGVALRRSTAGGVAFSAAVVPFRAPLLASAASGSKHSTAKPSGWMLWHRHGALGICRRRPAPVLMKTI
jgi:hypothetical protein